ncbi:MAG: hypothetical protein AAGD11_08220 [Planctomycetota bacterium]
MPINNEQISKLLKMIATVQPDELDCDGCSQHLAEFAETQLLGKTVTESQKAIQIHLQNCHCCEIEFNNLLAALQGIDEE